ncbi:MAG: hypothetical protein ACD_75C02558G0001 [uncultured bacterium]|nr:MAG: hypothetical protein ACD_75C02558G0001 [uncultured bacterium]
MPEEGVRIEIDLGIEGDEAFLRCQNQRIDLDQRAVVVDKEAIEIFDEASKAFHRVAGQAKTEGQLAKMVALQAGERIHSHLDDLLWAPRRHFLNVHAAFPAGNDDDGGGFPVDQEA